MGWVMGCWGGLCWWEWAVLVGLLVVVFWPVRACPEDAGADADDDVDEVTAGLVGVIGRRW
jgi:hypothetical protein